MPARPTPENLVIMAREPEAGRVKTRLAPALGSDGAAHLYEAFLRDTLELARLSKIPTRVFVTGGSLKGLRDSAPHVSRWLPQGPGDLGRRLRRAFDVSFRGGARRVVVLGTDSPGLPLAMVRSAFRALRTCDVVVGPAGDGGYYLLGLSAARPELLRGMPWSRSTLLAATAARARELGLKMKCLPLWFDVDHPEDLGVLEGLAALGALNPRPRHTLAALETLRARRHPERRGS
jgi:rSAM/selenodomain-associated transferase 1